MTKAARSRLLYAASAPSSSSLLRVVFSDKAECSQASIQVQIAACKPWWNTRCLEPVVVRSTRRRPRLGRKLLVGRDSQFASTPKQDRDLHDNNHAWKAYSRQLDYQRAGLIFIQIYSIDNQLTTRSHRSNALNMYNGAIKSIKMYQYEHHTTTA